MTQLLSAAQMGQRYGDFFYQTPKVELNPSAIPTNLLPLLPYACLWGVADDGYRSDLVRSAPANAIEDLRLAIREFEHEIDDWLVGDAADAPVPSDEYVAFSAMRMIVD